MIRLLIVYDLDTGRPLHMQEYGDSREAHRERLAIEAMGIPRREIIVLSGRIADMQRTHSKYFTAGWEALLQRPPADCEGSAANEQRREVSS